VSWSFLASSCRFWSFLVFSRLVLSFVVVCFAALLCLALPCHVLPVCILWHRDILTLFSAQRQFFEYEHHPFNGESEEHYKQEHMARKRAAQASRVPSLAMERMMNLIRSKKIR
jgi:hypothetical protein